MSGHSSVKGEWLQGSQQCVVYYRALECSYMYKLNYQPVRERVTVSVSYSSSSSSRINRKVCGACGY